MRQTLDPGKDQAILSQALSLYRLRMDLREQSSGSDGAAAGVGDGRSGSRA